jgi:hypothetical protein
VVCRRRGGDLAGKQRSQLHARPTIRQTHTCECETVWSTVQMYIPECISYLIGRVYTKTTANCNWTQTTPIFHWKIVASWMRIHKGNILCQSLSIFAYESFLIQNICLTIRNVSQCWSSGYLAVGEGSEEV